VHYPVIISFDPIPAYDGWTDVLPRPMSHCSIDEHDKNDQQSLSDFFTLFLFVVKCVHRLHT